jgi:tetratricopeptide (TPR) repeat protein
MWVAQLQKAHSLATLGRATEAESILAEFEKGGASVAPESDIGLDLHQLGSALLRASRFESADTAFRLAVQLRLDYLKRRPDREVENMLAGSYKMRAAVRLAKYVGPAKSDVSLLPEARAAVDEAITIRQRLVSLYEQEGGIPVEIAHDMAMTLNTKASVEGFAGRIPEAVTILDLAIGIMEDVTKADPQWKADLAKCRKDRSVFAAAGFLARGWNSGVGPQTKSESGQRGFFARLAAFFRRS